MEGSLWSAGTGDLLRRTASAEPTPGGGSIAAVTGAFGLGLVLMAIAVTEDPVLAAPADRAESLLARVRRAADDDVTDFERLMAAYRLPRGDDAERGRRSAAIEVATVGATERPLELLEALLAARDLADEVEPLVKASIVSDVAAGRDLVLGAARAGVHTIDINLTALERAAAPGAAGLRTRRDAAVAALEGSR